MPLRSFADALRPGGWLAPSLDHPFGPPLPDQHGGYFATELVSDTWTKNGVEVTQHFWRRPLSAVVAAFADAGFVVDRIGEPQPSAEALERWPDELTAVAGVPMFIVYRLSKCPNPGEAERAGVSSRSLLGGTGPAAARMADERPRSDLLAVATDKR